MVNESPVTNGIFKMQNNSSAKEEMSLQFIYFFIFNP